jgi:hypothetical protein
MMNVQQQREALIRELDIILETQCHESTELATTSWDSMACVMVIAAIHDITGANVRGPVLFESTTVNDILKLAGV